MPGAILLGDHIFFDVFVHFSLREGPKDLTRFSFFSSEKRRTPTTIASSSRLEEKVSKKKRGRKRKRKRERERELRPPLQKNSACSSLLGEDCLKTLGSAV
jgi:hypothetical protein